MIYHVSFPDFFLRFVFMYHGVFGELLLVLGVFFMAAGFFGRFFHPEFFDSTKRSFQFYRVITLALAVLVVPNVINFVWPFHVIDPDPGCDVAPCPAVEIPRGLLHHPDAQEEQLIRDGQYGKAGMLEGLAIVVIVSYEVTVLSRPKKKVRPILDASWHDTV